jgi:hypothetical protein
MLVEETLSALETEAEALIGAIDQAEHVIETESIRLSLETDSFRDRLIAIMGLGVFLNDVQTCRRRLGELSNRLPSPNGVHLHLQDRVCHLGTRLLRESSRVQEIEREAWDLAGEKLREQERLGLPRPADLIPEL